MTQNEALQIDEDRRQRFFLTGEPVMRSSYVASRYVSYLRRENLPVSMTASTGIAAAQLGGTTVHAWSGIGTRAAHLAPRISTSSPKTGVSPIASERRAR